MRRIRGNAGANEILDIAAIVHSLSTPNAVGVRLANGFAERFGKTIQGVRARLGGNRSTHHDLEICVRDTQGVEVWENVEVKGSQPFVPIRPDDSPWLAGVQFHNGGCEKYSIAKKYAKLYYDIHVGSGSLKRDFSVGAEIPSFEEWFQNDCRVQSDPKTAFGKELKRNVRAVRGPKTSLLETRAPVLDALEITEDDRRLLAQEVLPIANQALAEKQYWLTIHGNVHTGEFHFMWFPAFLLSEIQEVHVEKKLDVLLTFVCANDFRFHGILRWGKGAGFSNLRLDLK